VAKNNSNLENNTWTQELTKEVEELATIVGLKFTKHETQNTKPNTSEKSSRQLA
jgi:hypothetical protein